MPREYFPLSGVKKLAQVPEIYRVAFDPLPGGRPDVRFEGGRFYRLQYPRGQTVRNPWAAPEAILAAPGDFLSYDPSTGGVDTVSASEALGVT